MGRTPLPTALHELHGNPGKRQLPANEPKPTVDPKMQAPKDLTGDAAAEWSRLTKEFLRIGLVTTIDRGALAAYCSAYGRFLEAERKITELGAVVTDNNGIMRRNPWTMIQKAAVETMTQIGSQFGMTPATRPRLGRAAGAGRGEDDGQGTSAPKDDLEKFLGNHPSVRH